MEKDRKIKEIIDRYTKLKGDRSQWESLWEDTCTFVTPRRGGITTPHIKGGTRMSQVFSCTAIDANDIFAAGLFGLLCAPPWFLLRPPNPLTEVTDEQNTWFSQATRIYHDELALSNFNLIIFELFKDLGSIGTGCPYLEEGEDIALNFVNLFIADYVVQQNRYGIVDTIFRKIGYTARQAVQTFGINNVGRSVREASEDKKKQDEIFEFIHFVAPKEDWDGKIRFPFASVYVAVKDKLIVQEGGYYEFPYMFTRLDKESNEVYGRGIGIKMLPEIRLLNKMMETTIRAAEKVVDPPLMVPDDGFLSPLRTVPGGILYYRSGTSDRVEPLNTHANIGISLEMMQDTKDDIKRAFFVDLFQLLAERKNMSSAYEVLERVEEKQGNLSPMSGRLESDLFNPLIERGLGILFRTGRLPPPPVGIDAYSITYTGKLAMALKRGEVRAVQDTYNVVAPWVEADPTLLDNFDQDKIVRGTGERIGLPGEWLRPSDDVAEIREARQEQEEAMQQAQMAQEAAKVIPDEAKEKLLEGV